MANGCRSELMYVLPTTKAQFDACVFGLPCHPDIRATAISKDGREWVARIANGGYIVVVKPEGI